MKILNATIIPKSPMLLSNGEPEGLYDDSYVRDEYGLPYIPSKRLKGLLRESCLELMEWSGKVRRPHNVIDYLFGKAGEANQTSVSKVFLKNAELVQKKEFISAIQKLKKEKEKEAVSEAIDSLFSMERVQTQINDQGIAEEASLRRFKLLSPIKEADFFLQLEYPEELDTQYVNLLRNGLLNITRLGRGRNRGWGKVAIKIKNEVSNDFKWSELNEPPIDEVGQENQRKENDKVSLSEKYTGVRLRIKALSSLIIPEWSGDENTVSTKAYIPGSMIWGALAGKYIQNYEGTYKSNIMNDPTFRALFYDGGLQIGPGFPVLGDTVYYPAPRHWVRSKLEPKAPYTNMYDRFVPSGKGMGKYVNMNFKRGDAKAIDIPKSQSFHNSRGLKKESRSAGSNQDGGIYYYESIDKGSEFLTKIDVAKDLEQEFYGFIRDKKLRIGKSKNNQFGAVAIEFEESNPDSESNNFKSNNYLDLIFMSPTILINEKGFPDTSKKQIANSLSLDERQIEEVDCRLEPVQRFQGNLNIHLTAYQAIQPGSSLRIKDPDFSTLKKLQELGIGLETEKGYGRFRLDKVEKGLELDLKKMEKKPEMDKAKGELENDSILQQLKFQIAFREFQRKGFEQAKEEKSYKNGVYQALNWLAGCNGKLTETDWEEFQEEASKKVKDKFIGRYDLLKKFEEESKTGFNDSERAQLRYAAALTFVETLKSNLK